MYIEQIITQLKLWLPEPVRAAIRPVSTRLLGILRRTFVQSSLTGRDWQIKIGVPADNRDAFLASVLMGTLDLPVKGSYSNVLLCAQPKSGSLYMAQLLSLCLGFRNHQIGLNQAGGEIYYPRLLAAKYVGSNTISHCHAAPEAAVVQMIKQLDLQPVILTRNLLDTLVSRRDMLMRDRFATNMLAKRAIVNIIGGTHEYQMDVIIELFAHSYINFFVSWEEYRNDMELQPIYITYEEMLEDETYVVKRVAKELNVPVSTDSIKKISTKIARAGGINFSSGVSGRGRAAFSERQIDILRQKADFLGCADTRFLGFEK